MTSDAKTTTWDRIVSWELVLPPSRPSQYHLSFFEDCLRRVDRRHPIAILGSTPELCDLCVDLGFEKVVVLEKSTRVFQMMQQLRALDAPVELLEGDWLSTLQSVGSTFGSVLSDLTSGNVPYDSRASFYALISRALISGGVFIDKILTHDRPLLDAGEVLRRYLRQPLNLLTANYFSCEALFCSNLLNESELVDTDLFYSRLAGFETSPRAPRLLALTERITPRGCVWHYGRPWEKLMKDYCPELEVQSRLPEESGSPYEGFLSLFSLEKA